jgi:hypothetical protein
LGGDCPKLGNLVSGSGEGLEASLLDIAIGVLVGQSRGMRNAKSFQLSQALSSSSSGGSTAPQLVSGTIIN